MSDALPLPPRPNLEQYKKIAKEFLAVWKAKDDRVFRDWAMRWAEKIAGLRDRKLEAERHAEIAGDLQRISRQWERFRKKKEGVAKRSLSDAQYFVATMHGFESWPKFAKHLDELRRAASAVSAFESAADAIATGDAAKLKKLLKADPRLARARSTREHRATLLHYVSANGIEDYRQKTPRNIVQITKLLLDAGADVDAESEAYGGGCTTLGLVATSVHPERAGVQIPLLQFLLDRGARLDQPSAGGNSQSIVNACFANGQPAAAEFLAKAGAGVDLEGAVALGRLEEVARYLDETTAGRSVEDQKKLESGFFYACGYGQKETVEYLLKRDAVDASLRNKEGGTPLHWAAYGAQIAIGELLIERRAPIHAKDETHGATPLDTALWVWANSREPERIERCYAMVKLLARSGAKLDPKQWQNPEGEGSDMLEKIAADPRMSVALDGKRI